MLTSENELYDILLCNFNKTTHYEIKSVCLQKIQHADFYFLVAQPNLIEYLQDDKLIYNNCDTDSEKFLEVISVGISSLLLFVQYNWIGPNQNIDLNIPVDSELVKERLSIDGEDINDNIEHSELLYLSKTIFDNLNAKLYPTIVNIWRLRTLFLHQSIMDQLCVSLFNEFNLLYEELKVSLESITNENKIPIYIELSRWLTNFGKVNEALHYIDEAKKLLTMKTELIGDLGKRTHYQQNSKAQIRLKVNLETNQDEIREENLPDIVKLDDDLRLDSIKWDKEVGSIFLGSLEQSVILAEVMYKQKAVPQDMLSNEEVLPMLDYVLKEENCWLARLVALHLRSKLDSKHKRTVQRALTQTESLITNLNSSPASLAQRLNSFWMLAPSPKWNIEKLLAKILLSLGLVKQALDSYLKLQLWEDVILCYTILDMRHKAAEIIQQELDKKQSVKLLCLLGDMTDNVNCYEEAWQLSKCKSARPHRHWGQYHFVRKEYEECIPHLQKSLEINSLQGLVWLRLGYAAMSVENWELAAHAYRRYTALEPDSFEAWNNLARVYIAQGDKQRAHKTFLEALKTSYDNWQVWENFMITSVDVGSFDDVIRAYHRLLDLREKHLDVQVLTILTETISKQLNAGEEPSVTRLKQKCLELLGRITAKYPNEYTPWYLYAQLSDTGSYLRVQRLQRAHRVLVQDMNWSNDVKKCETVIRTCTELGQSCLQIDDPTLRSNVRLSLNAVKSAASKNYQQDFTEYIEKINSIIEKL